MTFSKNGVGIIIFLLSLIGVNAADTQVIELISALGTIVSFILLIWNQIDRKDTKFFIFKK